MQKKILNSLDKALINQKWHLGDVAGRIGHPFTWADTGAKPLITKLDATNGLMHYYYMYYVIKKTPEFIKTNKTNIYIKKLYKIFEEFFFEKYPYIKKDTQNTNSFKSQSIARAQDLSFIKKYAKNLKKNINVLDIGPGLCGMLPTLDLEYNLNYFAVEADPMTYEAQLEFLKLFCYKKNIKIFDTIEAEDYLDLTKIKKEISKQKICHIPSWNFDLIKDNTMDIAVAMFMLNELTYSGIFWLLSKTISKLKIGGYLYVRDSNILKPGCHNFDYNNELLKLGFEEVAFYRIKNRLDFFGIPRIYKKVKNINPSYDFLVKKYLGKYTSVASGLDRGYNFNKK